MLRATLKSLLARKLRLVLSGLAVVLGVMFVSGAFVLTDTLGRSFDGIFSTVYSATDVEVSGEPKVALAETEGEQVLTNMPADVVERVRSVPGVADATGVASADGARVIGANGKVVTSFGPPRLGLNWTGESQLVQLREGRGPTAPDEIAVNAALAKAAGIRVGDRVGVLTLQPKRTFTLVGIFGYSQGRDTIGGVQTVAFATPVAQELMLGEPNVFTSVEVRAADGVTPEQVRDRVAAALGKGYVVKTGTELAAQSSAEFKEALKFFNYVLLGFAGVALFVGVFLILNTFSIIVAQRTRELALMRAIGAGRRQMVGSVLLEALVIGLLASVLGLAAGVGVGALLAWAIGRLGGGGLELVGVGVPAAAVVSAFAVGLLVTVVAALLPAVRASRVAPVAAMHDAATPDRPLTRVTVAGTAVLAAGGAALGVGLSGNAGDATLWTVLAGVLVSFVGVALLTPVLARPVVSVLGRLFSWSVPGKLGRLNSGRNPRRTAITAAALMVGIALVTGVSVILSSVTESFDKLARDSVQAEIFVAGEQTGPLPPTFDAQVLGRAAATPGVAKVSAFYADQAVVAGDSQFVVAVHDLPATRDIFGLVPVQGSLGTLGDDQLVLDAETASSLKVRAGDRLAVQLSRGDARTYTVAGVFAESDLLSGVFLPESAARDFRVPQPAQAFIQLAPGATVAGVLPNIEALLADSPEVSAADRSAFVRQQTAQLDTILIMIQVLLALAILIAILGIVNTLALSVLERTRELGLLRAIGLRRGQVMRMVTVESVVISVFGALLGVAVGTGLGTSVVRALNDEGITELAFPWAQMGTYVALAAVVGVVAAVLPAIRAARVDVLQAIAYE